MKVILSLQGSKQELDRFCNHMDWKREERSHSRYGWSGTKVTDSEGIHRGNITVATSHKPCILEIEPMTAEEASTITIAAFTSGAISLMGAPNGN